MCGSVRCLEEVHNPVVCVGLEDACLLDTLEHSNIPTRYLPTRSAIVKTRQNKGQGLSIDRDAPYSSRRAGCHPSMGGEAMSA